MANRFGPRKVLGVREQLARVRGLFPNFDSHVHGNRLVAVGDLRPTSRSEPYRVRFEYEVGEPPRVHVLSPELRLREGATKLPHVYPGNRLCLYLPGTGEWMPNMSLAHTIIPWASEWLFYYETWHATGEWLGGGVHPDISDKTYRKEFKDRPYDTHD